MFTLIISLLAATGVFFAIRGPALSLTWSILLSFAAFLIIQGLSALFLHFKIKAINLKLQSVMLEARKKMEMKQMSFMRRPVGSPQQMMKVLERDQAQAFDAALKVCEDFKPLYRWNFFLEKQINTMKMSFYYQMGDFEMTDTLLKKCILMDPQSISMKLARMYLNKDPKLDSFFKKKKRMLRKDSIVLPALTYAWILVKQNRIDEAVKLLAESKTKTSNEVLLRNWEHLANNRIRQFSNADLGEIWYALRLEEMKAPRVQQKFAHAR